MRARRWPYLLALIAATACGDSDAGAPAADAAPDDATTVPIADASPAADRIDPLLWVDFSAGGCDSGGVDNAPCTGAAPLDIRFTATAPAQVDTFVWAFGDGTPSDDVASPTHRFDVPGVYDVGLVVGGPGGTASSMRRGFVVVEPAALGSPCDIDLHCATGLACVCGEGVPCPPGLAAGICSDACSALEPCAESAACTDLAPAGEPAEPQDWQRSLCVPGCDADDGCRDGFACRDLRRADATTGFVRGCFAAGVLADEGASCADATSAPTDELCVGGDCISEGARALCASACEPGAGDCPSYAACASFNDAGLGTRCVARCSPERSCSADPWLACEAPGSTGLKGFAVDEPAAAEGYCAPKSCVDPSDCGPDGDCADGYCGPA